MSNLGLVALILKDYDLAIRFFVDALQFERMTTAGVRFVSTPRDERTGSSPYSSILKETAGTFSAATPGPARRVEETLDPHIAT